MTSISPQRERERALFLYRSALERGDFATVIAVLKQAERDAVLAEMIEETAALDEDAPAVPERRTGFFFRKSKGITEFVYRRDPSPDDGWTRKSDQSEEGTDMFSTFIPARPFPQARKLTYDPLAWVAALIIMILLGAALLFMRIDMGPIGESQPEYAAPVPTATPVEGCAARSVADPQAESVRLAGEAAALLEADEPDAELAMLLGICALQTAYTPEADAALQQVMGIDGAAQTFAGNGIPGGVFSPNGRYLLTGDNTVLRLWDAETGEQVREFVGHTDYVAALAFSPDGRYVLSGSADKTVRLWDVETGQEIRQFVVHTAGELTVSFSPDGRYVLSAGDDPTARLWDAVTGEEIRQFTGHRMPIFGAAFSPDGRYVATSSWDTTVRLWDAATGEELRQYPRHNSFAGMVAFSADGKYLLNSGTYVVRLSDVETGQTIREYTRQGSRVLGFVSFSPDGRYVLASDRDNRLALLWDVETGELVRTFDGRRFDPDAGRMFKVNFSPDGRSIVMGTANDYGGSPYNRVWLWDTDYRDTIARACQHVARDFSDEERTQYGLGAGSACP